MTSLATTHGLAVAGSLFMLGGLAILGATLLNRALLSSLKTTFDTPAKMSVAGGFAVPLIGLGLFLNAAGNMADVTMGAGLTALLLTLAFGLLLFLMLDETIADALARKAAQPATDRDQPQLALSPPIREAIADAAKAETKAGAEAPKIALVS